MEIGSWTNTIDLTCPAGAALKKLWAALPKDRPFRITLFGSAPVQITVEPSLLIANVDLFSDSDLAEAVRRTGLDRGQSGLHIQICTESDFRTSQRWPDRAKQIPLRNVTFVFPHPIDILIAKLDRLEENDLEAFRVVIKKTGHPTSEELIHELQLAVDLFRTDIDEEQGRHMINNCQRLWPLVFGREIDPGVEIIAPTLKRHRKGFNARP
jgi:hypothetical protein